MCGPCVYIGQKLSYRCDRHKSAKIRNCVVKLPVVLFTNA